jgi:phosphoribosylaminoimidazolecarboxamide formyltransferase/IMP cyclohydrolase
LGRASSAHWNSISAISTAKSPRDLRHGTEERREADARSRPRQGGWQPDAGGGDARHQPQHAAQETHRTQSFCNRLIDIIKPSPDFRLRQTGVLEFAQGLAAQGVKLLSTGGTAKMLRDAGLAVTEIGDYTGFPEMLDGRVKTLHPKVHGGILARRDLPEHLATIEQHGIPTIDLVCVNLYPFAATIAKAGVTLEDAIENIDIGGPAMVRSSAKNYAGVAIVTDPEDYAPLLDEMKANGGALQLGTRFNLAKKAFTHTARYDSMIANWLTGLDEGAEAKPADAAPFRHLPGQAATRLRPHRNPALRRELAPAAPPSTATRPTAAGQHRRLHAAAGQGTLLQQHRRLRRRLGMRQGLRRPGLRHHQARQPVRRGHRRHLLGAYEKAFKTDSTSAFGGIIAFNGEVGIDVVNAMNERKHFVEVLIAPSFTAEAKAALAGKPTCACWSCRSAAS